MKDAYAAKNFADIDVASEKLNAAWAAASEDMYKFKTPTLRNVEKSSPYFHDGRTNILADAVNHYSTNIPAGSTVDTALVGGLPLSSDQKNKLVLFLKTLTDDSFLHDTRFSEQ